ncbi:MAG TPA: hypothetical protein VJ483_00405 [Holophagaceae bacterium]|nr:hypothetical protein [Holophagaceae bacterium]
MRLRPYFFAALAALLPAQDADAILARNIKARGGEARLAAVKTLRMVGRTALIPDIKRVPCMEEVGVPHEWRKELTLDGGYTEVDTFDGKEGWQLIPWAANRAPRPLPADAVGFLAEEERFWDLLLTYKAKGLKAEYQGKVAVGQGPMHKIRIPLTPSCDVTYYIDPATFQETQREQVWRSMGNEVKLKSTFDDFRELGGIVLPYFIERRAVGLGSRERMVIERVEINPPIAEARFGKPSR